MSTEAVANTDLPTQAPKAILFDLDGTLLDTAADLGAALNHMLEQHQRPAVPDHEFRPLASHGANGLLQLGFGDHFHANKQSLREQFLTRYESNIATHTVLYKGTQELLSELSKRGIAVAIVTNKPTFLTKLLLPEFSLLAPIEVVVCGDTLNVAKPDPAPLMHAAQALSVAASDCWYVGDAERDIEAGRRAGMRTILAEYGYIHANDEPHKWQADHHISAPNELIKLLP
ncbi:phosphoglycolate phosphatase [Pseudidiomarina planktonica]|uniref:Phosphoglycolate phosphatase n=1 Tax=Pseudidiomarina planktonica TaxID=1323738 RepID=A0A1Y6ESY5_9GAMM|nr:HAD-IA family hydrolase [Pseudidiomarina planktonica]RUO65357.1 phosphoglycolate phosphatase [Pseudidiomarina planktonica]SMQ65339.1 phosphoglycolate phosphatase [Pseudidiomarina planktonica]